MSDNNGFLIVLIGGAAAAAAAMAMGGEKTASAATPPATAPQLPAGTSPLGALGGLLSPLNVPQSAPPLPMIQPPQVYEVRANPTTVLAANQALRQLPAELSAVVADQVMLATPQTASQLNAVAAWLQSLGYQAAAQLVAMRAAEVPSLASLPVVFRMQYDANLPAAVRARLHSLLLEQRWPELQAYIPQLAPTYPQTAACFAQLAATPYDKPAAGTPAAPPPVAPGLPAIPAVPGGQPAIPAGLPAIPGVTPPAGTPAAMPPIPAIPAVPPGTPAAIPAAGAPPAWWPAGLPWTGMPAAGGPPAALSVMPKGATWDNDSGRIRYVIAADDYSGEQIAKKFKKQNPAMWAPSAVAANPDKKWGKDGNIYPGTGIWLQPEWGIPTAEPPVTPKAAKVAPPPAAKPAAPKPAAAAPGDASKTTKKVAKKGAKK